MAAGRVDLAERLFQRSRTHSSIRGCRGYIDLACRDDMVDGIDVPRPEVWRLQMRSHDAQASEDRSLLR